MLRKERRLQVIVEGLNVDVVNVLELEFNKPEHKLEVTQTISIEKFNCLPQGKFRVELLANVDSEIHNPGKVQGLMKSFDANVEAGEIIASRYLEVETDGDMIESLSKNKNLEAMAERLFLAQLAEKLDMDARNLASALLEGNLYSLSMNELDRQTYLATSKNFTRKAGLLFDINGNVYIEGVGLFTNNSTLMRMTEFLIKVQEVKADMGKVKLPENVENCIYNILKEAN